MKYRFIFCLNLFWIISTNLFAQWIQTNGPLGGTINCFAFNDSMFFAGTEGGLYFTKDNGINWQLANLTSNGQYFSISSLVLDKNRLYAGSEIGIYYSTDKGTTWSIILNSYGSFVAVNGDNIYAADRIGLYRSSDNGAHWSGTSLSRIFSSIITKDSVVIAGADHGDVYVSVDYGKSYSRYNIGSTAIWVRSLNRIENIFYAGTDDGIYFSTNKGLNWNKSDTSFHKNTLSLFYNGLNLYAGTSNGIYVSTNSGTSWSNIGPSDTYVTTLGVIGTNIFAGASNGVFLSTNNGSNWTIINNGLKNCSIFSIASNGQSLFAGTFGGLFISSDKGNNWEKSSLQNTYPTVLVVAGTNVYTTCFGDSGLVLFISSDNGKTWSQTGSTYFSSINSLVVNGSMYYLGTGSGMFVSNDKGNTWTKPDTSFSGYILSIAVKEGILFANSNGSIYYSTNNGSTWSKTALNNTDISSIFAYDSKLFANSYYDGILVSSDNGSNWKKVNNGLDNYNGKFGEFKFVSNGDNIIIGGYGIYTMKSNDTTWKKFGANTVGCLTTNGTELFVGTNARSVWRRPISEIVTLYSQWIQTSNPVGGYVYCFANIGTNIFIGTNSGLFKSTNGGVNWNILSSLSSVKKLLIKTSYFFAAANGGMFLSIDSGTTWNSINNGLTNTNVNDLVNSGDNLFVCTEGGGVFMSSNNGTNWMPINDGLSGLYVRGIAISDANLFVGLTGGTTDGVFLSTNNGSNWMIKNNGLPELDVQRFGVIGSSVFAGTSSNGVFCTTNNGSSWNAVNNGLPPSPRYPKFVASGTNLFAGFHFDGGVYLTKNNGIDWLSINEGLTDRDVRSLAVIENYVYLGTKNGLVFKRLLSDVLPTKVVKHSIQVPSKMSLAQNYPNPFNPSTNISFSLSSMGLVSLKVYDLIGREVATLVSGEFSAGEYTQQWNAEGLSSGVYFYRLQAGSFKETKKLVLLR